MSPYTNPDDGGGAVGTTVERPVARRPVMLELSGALGRIAEWAAVSIVGLLSIWFTFDAYSLGAAQPYVRVAWLSGVIYALVAELAGCYDVDARFTLRHGWTRVIGAWMASCVALLTLAFFLKTSDTFSRSWVLTWFWGVVLALVIVRGISTILLRRMKREGVFNQQVVIYGPGAQRDRLARYIRSNALLTIDLIGCYDTIGAEPSPGGCLPHRGGLAELVADIRAGRIDQVIVAMPLATDAELEDVVGKLAMFPVLVRLAPDLSDYALAGRPMVMLGDMPLLTLFERPINGFDQISKRIEDVVLGGILLLLFSPLLAIVAIAIKLDSPGPVFFRQEREGFNHQRFRIWKFRSMRTDMLQFDDIRQATARDPRVTRVGRILRGTSIDEVPQLLNVVFGEMSLVGPRPHAPSTRVQGVLFNEVTQNYAARHRVKPGMTGWAQVNGWRGETDTDEKLLKRIEYDLFYIEKWSIGFDFYIIVRTVAAVLFPKSAY